MSLRKWNDSKGYSRGAKGIDDAKGVDFVHPFRDLAAERAQFDRSWNRGGGAAPDAEVSGSKDTKKWSESPDYDTK